jgi:ParB family chromosome partitioning protein
MTTSAAENLPGHSDKDKEKVEKRRALGRGLASLLPGPRMVPGIGTPGQSGGTGGGQQIPPFGRNDKADGRNDNLGSDRNDKLAATATMTTGAEAPASFSTSDAALKGRSSAAVEGAPTIPSASFAGTEEIPVDSVAAANRAIASVETRAPHEEGSAYEGAYADPAGDLAGRPATDPRGFQPAYDSTAADGTLTINAQSESRVPTNLVINLAIANIDKNPFQTRYVEDDDALEELAESIKANGVVQPIVVRPATEDGRFTLVLGERRLHASRKAGKTHIPALVRRVSDQQAAEMTIVENLQREDLSPLEQAEAFRVLSNQFAMTQQQIAERVGLSRVSVANYMRLLKLPREVMQMLAEKRLNFAQAKELLKLGENDRIAEAALYAVKKGMNIEQIEMLVLRMEGLLDPLPDMPGVQKERKSSGARWVDPNVRAAQMDLERMLGVRVRIRDRKGKGKIVIEYATVDDYDRVVEMLRGKK